MCKTCQRVRAAAFAVIRTIVRADDVKNKPTPDDGGGGSKVSDLSS